MRTTVSVALIPVLPLPPPSAALAEAGRTLAALARVPPPVEALTLTSWTRTPPGYLPDPLTPPAAQAAGAGTTGTAVVAPAVMGQEATAAMNGKWQPGLTVCEGVTAGVRRVRPPRWRVVCSVGLCVDGRDGYTSGRSARDGGYSGRDR